MNYTSSTYTCKNITQFNPIWGIFSFAAQCNHLFTISSLKQQRESDFKHFRPHAEDSQYVG
jgi:hypothetical protein